VQRCPPQARYSCRAAAASVWVTPSVAAVLDRMPASNQQPGWMHATVNKPCSLLTPAGPLLPAPANNSCAPDFLGCLLRSGEGIIALNQSANRDEDVFDNPDRFDIRWGNINTALPVALRVAGLLTPRLQTTCRYVCGRYAISVIVSPRSVSQLWCMENGPHKWQATLGDTGIRVTTGNSLQ